MVSVDIDIDVSLSETGAYIDCSIKNVLTIPTTIASVIRTRINGLNFTSLYSLNAFMTTILLGLPNIYIG